jgi:hypothetical protein
MMADHGEWREQRRLGACRAGLSKTLTKPRPSASTYIIHMRVAPVLTSTPKAQASVPAAI